MFGISPAFITMIIPIIGSLFIIMTNRRNIMGIKAVSFWTALSALIFSIVPLFSYRQSIDGVYEKIFLNGALDYQVKFDTLSLLSVPIICLVSLLCILWLTRRKTQKKKSYYVSILLFEAFSIGAFYITNILLLYIFIEATIIPLYIIMSQRKDYSSKPVFYFLIYTMISAILVLIAFIMIYLETNTYILKEIYSIGVKSKAVFWLLALGIAIKLPIWPFYSWLPVVHVKNQTVCSILLASIVLKFSTLLLLRVMMPLFSEIITSHHLAVFIIVAISLIFALSQIVFQDDIKSVFAYFSIIHLNIALCIILIKSGLLYYIFSIMEHSILMPVLFFTANIIDKLYGTRSIKELQSSAINLTVVRRVLSLAFFAFVSLPFSWGFISEILTIQLISELSYFYAVFIAFIILISSFFIVYLYNSFLSYKGNNKSAEITDTFYITDPYKRIAFYIPFCLIVIIGIFPKIILGLFK